jgi:hypothetical protein
MLGALRSSVASPTASLRPSAHALAGAWQLAHATAPFGDSRASKKSRCPSAIAAGLPETRLLGSRRTGCGHGPCRRMSAVSCGVNATSACAHAAPAASVAAATAAAAIS